MEHIGIDLGGRESQICIRDVAGCVIAEGRYATVKLGEVLGARPKSRVVMETCAESRHPDIAPARNVRFQGPAGAAAAE